MMKVKPDKKNIADFIIVQLEKGGQRGGIMAKVVDKWRVSSRTFDRYWKTANQQHIEAQQVIKNQLAAIDMQSAIDERKRQIADVLERKEILTKILRGQIPLTKPMVVDGQIELVPVVPDWMDRRAAIAELNKMEGEYAPTKVSQVDKDGNDVTPVFSVNIIRPLPLDEL